MPQSKAAPAGVGGWLILFIIGNVAVVLVSLLALPEAIKGVLESWILGEDIGYLRPLLSFELAMHFAQIVVPVVGLVLIAIKSQTAPKVWLAYLIGVGLYAAIDIGMTSMLVRDLRPLTDDQVMAEVQREVTSEKKKNVRAMFSSLIWGLYWLRSVRVKNTFGPATPGTMPPGYPTSTPSPESVGAAASPAESDRFNRPTRECPYCRQSILLAAEYCRHCRSAVAGIASAT